MACPYLPTVTPRAAWTPRYIAATGDDVNACPGYTTSLPMVHEVVVAYPHWEAGTLADLIGDAPTRPMLLGLSALRAGIKERDADEAANATKGGA
jgi:hypothetical protein